MTNPNFLSPEEGPLDPFINGPETQKETGFLRGKLAKITENLLKHDESLPPKTDAEKFYNPKTDRTYQGEKLLESFDGLAFEDLLPKDADEYTVVFLPEEAADIQDVAILFNERQTNEDGESVTQTKAIKATRSGGILLNQKLTPLDQLFTPRDKETITPAIPFRAGTEIFKVTSGQSDDDGMGVETRIKGSHDNLKVKIMEDLIAYSTELGKW